MSDCYCGKQLCFEDCCQIIINNLSLAKTAEQVMRARYSAYVIGKIDFLRDSLHPDSRDEFDFDSTKRWAESSHWHSLKIIGLKAGTEQDKTGSVDFIAHYTDADEVGHRHCERSQFKRAENSWFFCDGQTIAPEKIGRNDPCLSLIHI